MTKIKGLDTLRAFAVFFVIIAHFGVWYDYTSPSGRFITIVLIPTAKFGVDLFFVLSGFLITSILLIAKDNSEQVSRMHIVKNFFIRRSLRIFPIYYLLLFFLLAVNYPDIKRYFWYYATYTSNMLPYQTNTWNHYCHTWTLSVEEQFYLLWPWLIVYIHNRYIKYVLWSAIVIGVVSTYIGMYWQGHMEPFPVYNNFDAFGIGGLYAWVRLYNKENRLFRMSVSVLALISLGICCYWKLTILNSSPFPATFIIKTCNCIIALWVIMLVINNKSLWVDKYLLSSRFLNYIGKISYGIYLYHFPYIEFFYSRVNKFLYDITLPYPQVNSVIHSRHVDYWIGIATMVTIAAISYRFIEKPLLRFQKRFTYTGREQVVPVETELK